MAEKNKTRLNNYINKELNKLQNNGELNVAVHDSEMNAVKSNGNLMENAQQSPYIYGAHQNCFRILSTVLVSHQSKD